MQGVGRVTRWSEKSQRLPPFGGENYCWPVTQIACDGNALSPFVFITQAVLLKRLSNHLLIP